MRLDNPIMTEIDYLPQLFQYFLFFQKFWIEDPLQKAAAGKLNWCKRKILDNFLPEIFSILFRIFPFFQFLRAKISFCMSFCSPWMISMLSVTSMIIMNAVNDVIDVTDVNNVNNVGEDYQ